MIGMLPFFFNCTGFIVATALTFTVEAVEQWRRSRGVAVTMLRNLAVAKVASLSVATLVIPGVLLGVAAVGGSSSPLPVRRVLYAATGTVFHHNNPWRWTGRIAVCATLLWMVFSVLCMLRVEAWCLRMICRGRDGAFTEQLIRMARRASLRGAPIAIGTTIAVWHEVVFGVW
ncbi:hypothetical protein WME98_36305 [Sorangium sp. So ce296]|uniref:hypothetical protein n=1 Tax=Sorangium sp. So ce296 TaxID=3133296 RepID=UPI003F6441ED